MEKVEADMGGDEEGEIICRIGEGLIEMKKACVNKPFRLLIIV